MLSLKGSEYLLDSYYTLDKPKTIVVNAVNYSLQHYQGDHKDEYTIKKDNTVCLFQNGVIKMIYEEDSNGNKMGKFTRFENGRVAFVQSLNDILNKCNYNRIVNHVKGERMEIYSNTTDHKIYHGEFNEKREREGWGIEYEEESGRMLLEGKWKNNKLVEIIRKIEGDIMIEFRCTGNNTMVSNRIPLYVGEFVYDELKESFIRNGIGYLIDEESRIATRECEWKDGKEVSGRDLYDGWYNPARKITTIRTPEEMNSLTVQVTDLVISSNCFNEMNELNLSNFDGLQSIEIGDNCFESVKTFKIDGMKKLKCLKIGKDSFTQVKQIEWESDYEAAEERANKSSKSFHILNCESLESIEIGKSSFADFGVSLN